MDRTFQRKFTIGSKAGIVLFALLALYFFWVKQALVGIAMTIIVVGAIEKVLNTKYVFRRVKPIDRDGEFEFLIIDNGRFSSNKNIPVDEIERVTMVHNCFGLNRSLLLQRNTKQLCIVDVANVEGFLKELNDRRTLQPLVLEKGI